TLRLSRLRDAPGALADFRQATAADPARADAVSLAAELLLESGGTTEALQAYASLAERLEASGRSREAAVLRTWSRNVVSPQRTLAPRPAPVQLLPPAGASLDG